MTTSTATHTLLRAEGFSCPSCVAKIEKQVGRLSLDPPVVERGVNE